MLTIKFEELFELEEIQKIQDAFAKATGVASIITTTNGEPITKPSNFCRLCSGIIRNSNIGFLNCIKSDSIIGKYNPDGPIMQRCLSGGLWDGGASISVNGIHIANWLIGQIRNDNSDTEKMLEYADKIGADRLNFREALDEVTIMSAEQFENVSNSLFLIANMISQQAFQKLEHETLNIELIRYNEELLLAQAELRNREVDLKFSEERFRSLVETSSDWVWELDLSTHFTYVSPRVENLLGYKVEEVIGMSGYDLMPPDEAEKISAVFDEFVSKKIPFSNLTNINIHKDGHRVILESSGWPFFDINGELLGYRGTDRDISERIKTQNIVVQTEKMMSVGGLAAGMAHEINNPLAAIVQGVQNISRRLSPDFEKNKEVAEQMDLDLNQVARYIEKREINVFLQDIKDAGIRAAETVRNMLNFSRQSEAIHNEENLNAIVEQVIDLASHDFNIVNNFDFKEILIQREYQKNIPLVLCVKSEIEQVILNILKNGAEVMLDILKHNSSEYVPTFCVRTSIKGHSVYIEIEDNGPGMNEEIQKRIFEPFYTTKPVGKGTGLGLSVSYFIITQNHKGKMWVETEENKGATFIIELPC